MTIAFANIAELAAGAIKLGSTDVREIWLGAVKVFPPDVQSDASGLAMTASHYPRVADHDIYLYVRIRGTATGSYALMIRSGTNPVVGTEWPGLITDGVDIYTYAQLTQNPPQVMVPGGSVPVFVTAGMTATKVAQAIIQAWNGQDQDQFSFPPNHVPLTISLMIPILLARLPQAVRDDLDIQPGDAVLRFSATIREFGAFSKESWLPLVPWVRATPADPWVEFAPAGTAAYEDQNGGAAPDPNAIPNRADIGVRFTFTDGAGVTAKGELSRLSVWKGPDAAHLVEINAWTSGLTLDAAGSRLLITASSGIGVYEVRAEYAGVTVVQQLRVV